MLKLKLISAVAVLLLCVSCAPERRHYVGSGVTFTLERSSSAGSVGETVSSEQSETEYFANKNTKKFHKKTCTYAKRLNQENIYICSSREQLIAEGYTPCGKCEP